MRAELVDDAGTGPAIAYLPGIGGLGAMAQSCVERLRTDFRALRLRYHAGGRADYAHLADSVAAVLDERAIDRALLLAESFGGGVAFELALRHPDRVRGLAIVNSFARYPRPGRLRVTRALAAVVGQRSYTWLRARVGVKKLLGPRYEPEFARRIAAKKPAFDRAFRERMRMVAGLDLRDRLGSVRQPVALFAADQDRILPSLPCAHELQQLLPDATLQVLRGTSHLVLPLDDLPWPAWMQALHERAGPSATTR